LLALRAFRSNRALRASRAWRALFEVNKLVNLLLEV
jgi:hypothetical protein